MTRRRGQGVRTDVHRGRRHAGYADPVTFAEYAAAWLNARLVRGQALKPRTRAHHRSLLDRLILPTRRGVRARDLTPELVRAWYGTLDAGAPTEREHCYALLKAVSATAVDDELLAEPVPHPGAGVSRRAGKRSC